MLKRNLFLILCLLLSQFSLISQSIRVINLHSNDIVYNSVDNRIYASIPSSADTMGNTICIIDPVTASVDTAVFIGSEPKKLALTQSGQTLFVALDGAAAVRSFNIQTKTAGQQFGLGNHPSYGPYYVEDMETVPESETKLVVSRKRLGVSPKHGGVAVYDSGVMLSQITQDHTGSNVIEAISETRFIGYNNESTEYGLRNLNLTAQGVQEGSVYKNMFSGFSLDIYHSRDRLYSTNGKALDVSSSVPVVLGSFHKARGPVVEDILQNAICFAYQDIFDDEVVIKKYDRNTFVRKDSILVNDFITQGKVLNLITWGAGRYAFNTDEGRIIIIDGGGIGLSEKDLADHFEVYPNPATDMINITTSHEIPEAGIKLYTSSGTLLRNISEAQMPYQLDCAELRPGMYFLHITGDQSSFFKSIMKH